MNKLAALLALLLWPAFALGQTGAYSGHTFVGGVPATTSGMNSSNYMDGIIPGASVTVYLTGTSTKATIYADGSNTPLSNPFFSNLAPGTNPGGFIFWSLQNQGLDIQAQGGMGNASCTTSPLCYSTATTLQTDVYPGGGGGAIIDACQQSGADGGAKVNAALAALGGPGTVTIDLSCGTTWTTPVVATAAGQTLQFLGGTFNLPSISLPFASDTIDGNNSTTLQVQAYSSGTSGLIQFYSGANVGSSDVVQNITLDGNWANTPSANTCFPAACRPAIRITNGGNSSAVHDIQTQNVVFQNWNNPPYVVAGHGSTSYVPDFPLSYNLSISGDGTSCQFQSIGTGVIEIYGWDHNITVNGCYFADWGDGLTEYHADPIATQDMTGYPGTSEFTMDVSNNIFYNTQLPARWRLWICGRNLRWRECVCDRIQLHREQGAGQWEREGRVPFHIRERSGDQRQLLVE